MFDDGDRRIVEFADQFKAASVSLRLLNDNSLPCTCSALAIPGRVGPAW